MYELVVQRDFCAAHAIVMRGRREPVHGHTWRVEAAVAGESLDQDGLLCDFHALETRLDEILRPFRDADLNATEPFDRVNPTAELVARHVAERLAAALADGIVVRRVTVTEAPGCRATYLPSPGAADRPAPRSAEASRR